MQKIKLIIYSLLKNNVFLLYLMEQRKEFFLKNNKQVEKNKKKAEEIINDNERLNNLLEKALKKIGIKRKDITKISQKASPNTGGECHSLLT